MALTNSYASLDEFLALPDLDTAKPTDDVFVERLLERCSREFDGDTGHWFYGYQQTRTYDRPCERALKLDAPLLSVTSLTNGDNTNIAASEYRLYPLNGPHKDSVVLRANSSTLWQMSTDGESEGVVSVRGLWGYVSRDATDPESAAVILNSKSAVLSLALTVYKGRYGIGIEGVAQITGAGVVITPRDKTPEYTSAVMRYRRIL